ncbi:hypothetical protein A0H76_1838 [Hepatospora eriocheir]|uniref:Uncharacterized protein n=1 Tax=Hepatospora eriocheir TaxID=1081669 RepID=A0A1X0QGE7_9MICR|nr:hypothetical protein A0H76_1838 [Hepatospora eriocheir]
MEIITKVVREVLLQFYIIFFVETSFIVIIINNTIKNDKEIELFKIIYFLLFVIILFSIVIGLFASNSRIRGIAISITGGFLIYELLILILIYTAFIWLRNNLNNDYKGEEPKRFVEIYVSSKKINEIKTYANLSKLTPLSDILIDSDASSEDSILKISYPCLEFLIYIIIFTLSNKLKSIDKTLVFLVLTIMSFKACLKSFFEETKGMCTYLKITGYDIFCLITYAIIFILSSYVKFVRDILINVILSIFYGIILSLFISTIYIKKMIYLIA